MNLCLGILRSLAVLLTSLTPVTLGRAPSYSPPPVVEELQHSEKQLSKGSAPCALCRSVLLKNCKRPNGRPLETQVRRPFARLDPKRVLPYSNIQVSPLSVFSCWEVIQRVPKNAILEIRA